MKSYRFRNYILCLTLLGSLVMSAAPIDEARKLYRQGEYEKAITRLKAIVKKSPRDGTANYFLGASLMAAGHNKEAIAPLEKAVDRGVADASRLLAKEALRSYRVDDASAHMERWEKQLTKDRKDIPESFGEMNSEIVTLRNMLDRVEKIEILDSLTADSADFFKALRLSANAGVLLPAESMKSAGIGTPGATLSSAYMPEYRNRVLWSESDGFGNFALHGASILDDGTIGQAALLDGDLGEGGNAKFPFLMPDGVTLYFSHDGPGSLGGYDIYMTRQSDDGSFFTPQNMGFPYNSTANDYMLAIDESAGLGWLVTDRNAPEGKVTVYVFTPSPMRVNVEPGDPNLLSYALLDNIALTRQPDTDYSGLLKSKLPELDDPDTEGRARFVFDSGNGHVYTSLHDFHSRAARGEMIKYLAAERELEKHLTHENEMRVRYSRGEKGLAQKISASEKATVRLRDEVNALRNSVASLENKKK